MKNISQFLLTNLIIFASCLSFMVNSVGANDTPEKPMVIVITSFNNKNWYQWNLDSVFTQNYSNYRVIYLDDASTDGTANLVEHYIADKNLQERVTLIKNKTWLSQMANHYRAVRLCEDHEIVVHLDGDDALSNRDVLKYINNLYSTSDTWITYGSPLIWPANDWRPQFIIDSAKKLPEMAAHNTFRAPQHWHFGHLRTFYAWLFKHIPFQDLIDRSSFLPLIPAPDVGMMIPMLEMAATHVTFTDPVLYLWNRVNPLSQPADPQVVLIKLVCSWQKYQPLSNPNKKISKKYVDNRADVLLIASNPQLTLLSIESIMKHLRGIDKISIICNKSELPSYTDLQLKWSNISFVDHDDTSFDLTISQALAPLRNHVILASDKHIVTEPIDINSCIQELEAAKAYGFYFYLPTSEKLLNKGQEVYAPMTDTLCAWQPKYGLAYIPAPNALGFTLYRKRHLKERLLRIKYINKEQFESVWAKHNLTSRKVGLFFKQTKVQ